MTNFEGILRTILSKKAEVENSNKSPYYLLMSLNVYLTFLDGMVKQNNLNPKINIDFFQGMEVVIISSQEEVIEVKGINLIDV